MKNILLIIPYGGVGGMERLAFSFYNYYKKEGYFIKALKFIKLENDIINFGEDELFFSDHDFSDMSKTERLKFYFSIPYKLRKVIKKHKITHSISFGAMPNVYSSLTFTKDYKVASIHALKSVELSNDSLLSKMTRFGYKYTYKKLDKVVCISNAIKEDLIEKCNFRFVNKLEVIYNPHDVEEIQKRSLEDITLSEEMDLLEDNSILFIGRLSTQKSPWHLIKAFSLVLKNIPEAKLIFIGDGDGRVLNHLEDLIEELKIKGKIHFLGRRKNPYKYLAKAKILALASHYEGTPNVIVEAMCLGTPIVSSCCTYGVVELMSLKNHVIEDKMVTVEAGIITPNLYKNRLGIPETNDFIEEEYVLAEAIELALKSKEYKQNLEINKDALLRKFDLEKVANEYLK
ncbi:glycosyltransferase [Aquimarina muelleri]|uniref:Glycosyl transferase n=1 Tax=Aquimarina muelleri TaxID=279356 RepID=A0A918JXC0_9FLAO|nr:glycosyltransferase [Aquimarina muelleri]MCX2762897.1 glycosyltransferase [Aquimarina muelleri]GGX27140.1 glycosyl transferase [Aquimarina muelleri]